MNVCGSDIWAVGCMFGELLTGDPMFQSREVSYTRERPVPFQEDQLRVIFSILGTPKVPLYYSFPRWRDVAQWPEYPNVLDSHEKYGRFDPSAKDLLKKLLEYDPTKRITAKQALEHQYFKTSFSDTKFVKHICIYHY